MRYNQLLIACQGWDIHMQLTCWSLRRRNNRPPSIGSISHRDEECTGRESLTISYVCTRRMQRLCERVLRIDGSFCSKRMSMKYVRSRDTVEMDRHSVGVDYPFTMLGCSSTWCLLEKEHISLTHLPGSEAS